METLAQDLRFALRGLRKRPGHAAAVVLTLALGIGVNAAVFSVVNAVMLRPLPYPEPDRILDVLAINPRISSQRVGVSPADFLVWREESTAFASLGAYVPFGTFDLTGEGEPVRLSRHLVSEGLLGALGVRPEVGRLFVSGEYRTGGPRAVLLSHSLWRGRFGGDPAMAGKGITLSGEVYEVVGVLPEGFRIPGGQPDLVAPLVFRPEDATDRSAAYLGGIGRLRPGVTLEQAQAELGPVTERLARQFPGSNEGVTPSLKPLQEVFAGPARTALLVLSGAVGFVLLIAAANVANLQLARAASREPEMVLRAALGAGSRRLARQLLTESVLLALLGGACGLLLALLMLSVLPDARGLYLPKDVELGLDGKVLGFAFLLSLLAGFASGLLPALRAARGDLYRTLQSGGRGAGGGERSPRSQELLVVTEIALALVLLTGAGLLLQSFLRLQTEDLGFEPEGVLTFALSVPEASYPESERIAAFYGEALGRIGRIPGVVAAGAAKELPPAEPWSFLPEIEGRTVSKEDSAGWQLATEGLFPALGIPVLQGRAFTAADREGASPVMIASRSAALRFFPGGAALGRRVLFNAVWYEVVGIVGDQKTPGAPVSPVFYMAHSQLPVPADYLRSLSFAVRTKGDPLRLAGDVRKAVWELDANLPVSDLQTMEARLAAGSTVARSRFNTVLLVTFAALALVLAMVGIYGVLSYQVSRRTHELGLRMALGAGRADLFRLVLSRGLLLTVGGIGIGLLGAFALTRVLESLLFGVGSLDVLTFAAAVPGLVILAILACSLPARRASRLDPLEALREE
ncbi:MAG TPA: ABC transporter permease [Thermoanaerobaculia bacterium]|nr:ABC transporter permease [Thermoanaerobaculia bacterium]